MDRQEKLDAVAQVYANWEKICRDEDPNFNPENPTEKQEFILNYVLNGLFGDTALS